MATVTQKSGGAAKGPVMVATTAELQAAFANGHTAEEISIKSIDVEAIRTEAHAKGVEEGKKDLAEATTRAATEATTAERKRVTGLKGVAMKGFENEVAKAIESGTTVEAYAVEQAKLANTRGTSVATIAGDAPPAVRHGGHGEEPAAKSGWGKITQRANKKRAVR